jgi:tetratricopeptide (TPR) repeat protein
LGQASRGVEGETLGYLAWGQAIRRKGESLEARTPLEQAIQLARLYQNRDLPIELLYDAEWVASVWLGSITMSPLHDHAGAREHVTQGMQLCQMLKKVRGELTCFYNLGSIASDMQDYTAARRDYERALTIARQLGYRWGEACALRELSNVLRLQGEYTLAYDLAVRARAIWDGIGSSVETVSAIIRLGQLNTYLGNYALAQACFDQFFRVSVRSSRLRVNSSTDCCHLPCWHITLVTTSRRWCMPSKAGRSRKSCLIRPTRRRPS